MNPLHVQSLSMNKGDAALANRFELRGSRLFAHAT